MVKKETLWHIQKEKFLKQEEIKGGRTTKLRISKLRPALQLENHIYTTEHTGTRENFTTEVRY